MKSITKQMWFLCAVLVCSFFGAEAQANTITAASCNVSDVQAAINTANNGDTVIIPNGSCSWSSGVTITKQITLQGQTVGGVTIIDTDANGGFAGDNLLNITIGNSYHTTIANLRFDIEPAIKTNNGCIGSPSSACRADYILIQGNGLVPLMHDMYFYEVNSVLDHAVRWLVTGGVIWNTTFESLQNLSGACGSQVGSQSGSLVVKSNLSWDAPSTMGTLDANGVNNLYIEDSAFNNVGQTPDLDDNARVVIRHTVIQNSAGLTHGSTGTYGGRWIEFYNDQFKTVTSILNGQQRYFWWRAGSGIVTNNTIDSAQEGSCFGGHTSFVMAVENAARSGNFGCATSYMGRHQTGSGASAALQSPSLVGTGQVGDAYQISDAIYFWNNTGTGATSSTLFGFNDGTPRDCTSINPSTGKYYTTTDFMHLNRDYFVDYSGSPTSGAKPGWQPYTYPHPLRQNSGSGSVAAPNNLTVIVN